MLSPLTPVARPPAAASLPPPWLPAIVMKDLTFFNDGNKARVDGGLVNVDKLRKMAARAMHVRVLSRVPYTGFAEDAVLQNYVSHLRVLAMEQMIGLSEALEPRPLP